MIQVTRLNGTHFYVNAELIQTVESTPDTVISLGGGIKIIVHDSAEEVIQRIINYKKQVYGSTVMGTINENSGGE